jgi:hypothetical protein
MCYNNYKKLLLTWLSSCLRSVERASTHVGREGSCGSIFVHNRETTAIAECRVSLCTWQPLSRMNESTQFRPPASKTGPASRVQISSKTCQKITHFSNLKKMFFLILWIYYSDLSFWLVFFNTNINISAYNFGHHQGWRWPKLRVETCRVC